jgi:hypothetical protein
VENGLQQVEMVQKGQIDQRTRIGDDRGLGHITAPSRTRRTPGPPCTRSRRTRTRPVRLV